MINFLSTLFLLLPLPLLISCLKNIYNAADEAGERENKGENHT